MTAEYHVQWQNRTYKPRAKEALPKETFYTTGKMTFGKEEIHYGHLGSGAYGRRHLCVLPRSEHPGHGRSFYRWKLSDPRLVHGWVDRCEGIASAARPQVRRPPFVATRADDNLLKLTNEQTKSFLEAVLFNLRQISRNWPS